MHRAVRASAPDAFVRFYVGPKRYVARLAIQEKCANAVLPNRYKFCEYVVRCEDDGTECTVHCTYAD